MDTGRDDFSQVIQGGNNKGSMAPPPLDRVDRPYDVLALEARNISNEKLLSHVSSQVRSLRAICYCSSSVESPQIPNAKQLLLIKVLSILLFFVTLA